MSLHTFGAWLLLSSLFLFSLIVGNIIVCTCTESYTALNIAICSRWRKCVATFLILSNMHANPITQYELFYWSAVLHSAAMLAG